MPNLCFVHHASEIITLHPTPKSDTCKPQHNFREKGKKKQKQEFLIFLYALQQQKIIVAYNFEIASVSINGRNKYYEVVVHLKMLKCCTENAFRGIRCSTPYPSAFIFF